MNWPDQYQLTSCLRRLCDVTQSNAVILMSPTTELIDWVGQGTQVEATEISVAVTRLLQQQPDRTPPDGPVWWHVFPTAILIICHQHTSLSMVLPDCSEYLRELGQLLVQRAQYETTRTQIRRSIHQLSKTEQRILDLRYGITDSQLHTFDEVSREFGVSPERIREIETQALRTIWHQ
ncbi:MAG: sigma factor-like helix-turn-helix DNA-binding protein [Chloroflexota bacterium]